MSDATRATGSSGTMMIRDLGNGSAHGAVEFWLNSNNSSTWSDHIPWGFTINGATGSGTYNYPAGAGWRRLGSWHVTTAQTVTFRLGATGTSGFGGPTNFSVAITRSTVPGVTGPVTFSSITSTSVVATFVVGSNGGSAIDNRQIIWGISPNQTEFTNNMGFTTSANVTGLLPRTTYYFWGRTHNANGWGPWSARSQVTTLGVPDPPSVPVLSNIQPTSVDVSWTPNGDGGSPITGFTVGYGTSPSSPSIAAPGTSPKTISGLIPGTTYYFWVRAQNAIGASAYAGPTSSATIAGARVKVSGVYKIAVPYVKVSGVWKLAVPWVKIAGEWKQTT
jgi:hypothetical protein